MASSTTLAAFLKLEGSTAFDRELKKARSSLQGFAAAMRPISEMMLGMGAAITGLGILSSKTFVETGFALQEMSEMTGVSVETLSELQYAADRTGVSMQAIQQAFKGMALFMGYAESGSQMYNTVLKQLGLSLAQLKALNPEQQFLQIAGALANVSDATERAYLVQRVFNETGIQLLPLLAAGSKGLDEMRQRAHELGVAFDENMTAQAVEAHNAFTDLKASAQGLQLAIGSGLAPALTPFINGLTTVIGKVGEWTKNNPALTRTIFDLGLILVGGGGLLFALGQIAKAIQAINIALALMKGLSGPAGWAQLAAGLAIAGGAIYGINRLTSGSSISAMAPAAAGNSQASVTNNMTNINIKGDLVDYQNVADQVTPFVRTNIIQTGQRNFNTGVH